MIIQKTLLKEIILFVALIVLRKTLQRLLVGILFIICCVEPLATGRWGCGVGNRRSRIGVRGSVQKINSNYKWNNRRIAEINIRNWRIYFQVNFYALSSNHLRDKDKVHIKKLCVSSVLPGLQCFESRKILPFWRCWQENIHDVVSGRQE